MFLRKYFIPLLLLIVSCYAADWTADPDCSFAVKMDENTGDIIDLCGTFNGDMSGTVHSAPVRIEGKFFGGLKFQNGSYLPFGDVDFMDGKDHFTFSFWLSNSENYSTLEREIFRQNGTMNVQESAGVERVYIWTSVEVFGKNIVISADNLYPSGNYWLSQDGNFHFYHITYDGSEVRGYRDCNYIGGGSLTGTLKATAGQFTMGRMPPEEVSGPDYPFTGNMDDIMFLDRVIDSDECTDLMTNGIDGTAGHYPQMFKGRGVNLRGVTINGG